MPRAKGRAVSRKALVAYTRALSVLVGARVALVPALSGAAAQAASPAMQAVGNAVAADVGRGLSLSAALAAHPRVFPSLYAHLVRVGEATATLDAVLSRLADHLEKADALRRKLRLAMVYPAVVLAVAALAVAFLLAVIVPTFADMFADFGAELPASTRILLAASGALTGNALGIGAGALAAVLGARLLARRPAVRAWRDRAIFRIPGLGSLYRKGAAAQFCHTLGTLLQSGVPLADALRLLAGASANGQVRAATAAMLAAVVRGQNLTRPLREHPVFPPVVEQLVAVGEETAELDRVLLHLARHLERETDEAVDALSSVVEPALIVLIGAVVGSVLVALYLPMFDLLSIVE